MARKYARKPRRKTPYKMRRKRLYKRKSSGQGSQGYVNEKLRIVLPIKLGGEFEGTRRVCFPIGQTLHPGADPLSIKTFDNNTRWDTLVTMYEQYAVKGLKIKFIPTNITGQLSWQAGAAGNDYHTSQIRPIQTWYDVDTYDPRGYNEAQAASMDSFRVYQPNRTFKRYFSNKGPVARAKKGWQNCQGWSPLSPAPNGLPHNSFAMMFQSDGFPTEYPSEVGLIVATWYVTFRGRQVGQIV